MQPDVRRDHAAIRTPEREGIAALTHRFLKAVQVHIRRHLETGLVRIAGQLQFLNLLEYGYIELGSVAFQQLAPPVAIHSSPERIAGQVRVQMGGGHDLMLGVPRQQTAAFGLLSQGPA
ncbi:hypothetical protein D3C72_1296120 [compost metagenome]